MVRRTREGSAAHNALTRRRTLVGLSRILFVLSACLFVSIAAQAGPIYRYTYSGPNYFCCGVNNTSLPYTTDMHFQLVVDFDAPLAADVLYVTPLDWSGFDGVNALSSDACTSCTTSFRIGSVNSTPYPSAPGPVQGWDISIWDTSHGISWSSWWGCGGCGDQLDSIFASGGWAHAYHNSSNAPTLWSSSIIDAPEPPTLLLTLLGLGLGIFIGIRFGN